MASYYEHCNPDNTTTMRHKCCKLALEFNELQLVSLVSVFNQIKIFFYSGSIFKSANIQDDYIQYAVLATGGINVLATIVAFPLIDKLGRKPLLVYPLIFMIFDFIALTFFLAFKVC
jgi:hypothetical protein